MTNDELIAEFPSMYKHKGMIDFSPPPGWLPLIHQLSLDLLPHKVKAVQVKEKFGSLRYYVANVSNAAARLLIDTAEKKSQTICQTCGEPGERSTTAAGRTRVACETHRMGE